MGSLARAASCFIGDRATPARRQARNLEL